MTGHPVGTARDIEEAMRFAVLSGMRPHQEMPLRKAADGYVAMEQGRARYRAS